MKSPSCVYMVPRLVFLAVEIGMESFSPAYPGDRSTFALTNRGERGWKIDVGAHGLQVIRAPRRRPYTCFNCGFTCCGACIEVRVGPDMQEARDVASRRIHRGED